MATLWSVLQALVSRIPSHRSAQLKSARRARPNVESLEDRTLLNGPSANEQYMLQLINQMRMDPTHELQRINAVNDPNVNSDMSYYGVDRQLLAEQFAQLTPQAPLAWNAVLSETALYHNQAMLQSDRQSHQVPGEPDFATRLSNAGYDYTTAGENVFAYAQSPFYGHAGFAIDWGNTPTGIQNPPDHRVNIMDSDFTEIGLSIIGAAPGKQVGPLLITQDMGDRFDRTSPYLLGAVFADANHNNFYDPGEGLGGVTVQLSGPAGDFTTQTMTAGGYQIAIPSGTYSVTFTGGALQDQVTKTVTIGDQNVAVDVGGNSQLPATHFRVDVPAPTTSTAGAMFAFTVTALDAFNHPASNYEGTVHFSSSDPQAVLPGDYTFTASDGGARTFYATFATSGTRTLSAMDTAFPSTRGTSAGVVVMPAGASRFLVTGFPSSLAGVRHYFTVTALDDFGNRATSYRGAVQFGSSDPQALLPKNYNFTGVDNGAHTFVAALKTAGTQALSATDLVDATLTGAEDGIGVYCLATSISGPTSGVRGQPLTFSLSAAQGIVPANSRFRYRIDWNGDGILDQVIAGGNAVSVTRVFPVSVAAGRIRVTAVDTWGRVSIGAAQIVSISPVVLSADPIDPGKTALIVGGTNGNDNIALSPSPADSTGRVISVKINGMDQGSFNPTGHIVVYGLAGNDTIKELPSADGSVFIAVSAILYGGLGNNRLDASGSSANNILIGSTGRDTLTGGAGIAQSRNILIGGRGADVLKSTSGEDVLIGGYTDHDSNLAALYALMAEWSRTDTDYQTRIDHLSGIGSGSNGGIVLSLQTVHHDAAVNALFAGTGQDWLIGSRIDAIHDATPVDVTTII